VRNLRKYALSVFAVTVLSLTVANVTALATCYTDVQDEYTCYPTGREDANYCYYNCYCKVSAARCDAALAANGYESY
jgi:hypothetical protein